MSSSLEIRRFSTWYSPFCSFWWKIWIWMFKVLKQKRARLLGSQGRQGKKFQNTLQTRRTGYLFPRSSWAWFIFSLTWKSTEQKQKLYRKCRRRVSELEPSNLFFSLGLLSQSWAELRLQKLSSVERQKLLPSWLFSMAWNLSPYQSHFFFRNTLKTISR